MELVRKNRNGFTLIEVMIALIIFSVTMLALLSSLGSIVHINLQNSIRDEAVKVAEENLLALKSGRSVPESVTMTVRGIPVGYSVVATTETEIGGVRHISVSIFWTYKGSHYQHSVSTIMD